MPSTSPTSTVTLDTIVSPSHIPPSPLLLGTLPFPSCQVDKVRAELASLPTTNPQGLMLEALHSAAFAGALGQPLLAHDSSLARLTGSALADFVKVRGGGGGE